MNLSPSSNAASLKPGKVKPSPPSKGKMTRVLGTEILDHLDFDSPDAIRSRADLRRINWVLGNHRWMLRSLNRIDALRPNMHLVEIGAGCGTFGRRLANRHPGIRYSAIDLNPQPSNWPSTSSWLQGDLMNLLPALGGKVLLANLVLHHLKDDQLQQLGCALENYESIICCEPARFDRFHVIGNALRPLGMNHVTWHDLHVSIDAGFRNRDLPDMLGLTTSAWNVRIDHTPLGIYRMIATRNTACEAH